MRREPSSESQVLEESGSELRTRGRYSQPVLRSGIQRLAAAPSLEFFSQPYWWPTTVPTNQVLLVQLQQHNNPLHWGQN